MSADNLAANDKICVKVACLSENQLGLNVFQYKVLSVVDPSMTLRQFNKAYGAAVAASYAACLATTAEFYGTASFIYAVDPLSFTETDFSSRTGGPLDRAALPEQVSGIITKQTGKRGRAFRGRIYVPFPSIVDSELKDSQPSPTDAYITLLDTLGSVLGMRTDLTITSADSGGTATIRMVIQAPVAAPPNPPSTVTDYRSNDKWATQRRRGDYGRPNDAPW